MISTKNSLLTLSAVALALGFAGTSRAQEERWFKIELMVFSQQSASAARSEAWDPTPTLQYPGESRFLVDPELVDDNLETYDATGIVDEFGHHILTISSPFERDIDRALAVGEQAPGEKAPLQEEPTPDIDASPGEAPPPATEAPRLTPSPFTILPASAMEFPAKAARMESTGIYQIQFHRSWVQPVLPRAAALPIVLDRSGDTGQWPKLQGSIKLYLSRYLHLETDLWLNTRGEYLPGSWQIPPPPLGPPSLLFEPPEEPTVLYTDDEPLSVVVRPELDSVALEEELIEDLPEESGPHYPWRHAVRLQQKRRMRSTEVHYIDHPMLGVVVLVSPLSDDELEAMALAELTPDAAAESAPIPSPELAQPAK